MKVFFLIKIGEILLKLGNRKEFENHLKTQLHMKLSGRRHDLETSPGRYFLVVEEKDAEYAEFVLSHTPGVNGYVRAVKTRKDPEEILAAAENIARAYAAEGKYRFKAETRRADKSFVWNSYQTSSGVGERVTERVAGSIVDLHNPEYTITVEIRERVYVYGDTLPGLRGLPVKSEGLGLLLLSGGIDSPVAGYMMARRGMALNAVYFHAYPYTSEEARRKVVDLARVIAAYTGGLRLWTVPFTEVQMALKSKAPELMTTLFMRGAMMEISHMLARKINANCLITGESLGQVASQTPENLRFTQSRSSFAVMRPLIGLDKEDTIASARKIGTYEISIQPYEDCCALFSPKHPVLKADFAEATRVYESLGLGPLLDAALASASALDLGYDLEPAGAGKE